MGVVDYSYSDPPVLIASHIVVIGVGVLAIQPILAYLRHLFQTYREKGLL